MADDKITLAEYHTAIKDALTIALPEVLFLDDYTRQGEKLPATPAIIMDLSEWRRVGDGQDSTGLFTYDFIWSLYVVTSFKTPKLQLRELTLKLCEIVEQNRWGLPLGPARIEFVEKDDFDPDWDAYETMRLEFMQEGRVGVNAWDPGDAEFPNEVCTSSPPEIGEDHEEDYDQVIPKYDD